MSKIEESEIEEAVKEFLRWLILEYPLSRPLDVIYGAYLNWKEKEHE